MFGCRTCLAAKGNPIWQEYSRSISQSPRLSTPLGEIRFVVLDTETGSLNARTASLLSIGAVGVRDWSIPVLDTFECFLENDSNPEEHGSIVIHGILPQKSPDAMESSLAIDRFIQFISNSVLVGHYLAFDLAVLNRFVKRRIGHKLRNRSIDTVHLARRLDHLFDEGSMRHAAYSLDALCERFHIHPHDRHTAAGDAYLTALLFLKMLDWLERRGVRTLGGLMGPGWWNFNIKS